jgi:putative endonuclease
MFYAYVLQSLKDGKLYIGHAEDVEKRLTEHNNGKVPSTKFRSPFKIVHQQVFPSRSAARWQEKQWKTAWGHKKLYEILEIFPK